MGCGSGLRTTSHLSGAGRVIRLVDSSKCGLALSNHGEEFRAGPMRASGGWAGLPQARGRLPGVSRGPGPSKAPASVRE